MVSVPPFFMTLSSTLPLVECTGNASSSAGTKSIVHLLSCLTVSFTFLTAFLLSPMLATHFFPGSIRKAAGALVKHGELMS